MKTRYSFILFTALLSVACSNENGQTQEPFSVDTTPIEMYVGDNAKIKATGAVEFDNSSSFESIDITEDGVLTAKLPGYAEVIVREKNNSENTAVVPLKILGRHPLISSNVDYELITYWKDNLITNGKLNIENVKSILNTNQCTGWEYKMDAAFGHKFYHLGDVDSLVFNLSLYFYIDSNKADIVLDFLKEQTGKNDFVYFDNGIDRVAPYKGKEILIYRYFVDNCLCLEFGGPGR